MWESVDRETDYYFEQAGPDVAITMARRLKIAVYGLADFYGYSRIAGLPSNYRRVIVKPFYIFYRLAQAGDHLTVYLLRHEKRRSLSPSTHKRLASEAERDSTEL